MVAARRIEGYAIVSEDGMLANSMGLMPQSLKFSADQQFFEHGLDGVDVVVHGRHSNEQQRNSPLRRRVILTREIGTLERDPSNEKAVLWNPAGASFEEALAAVGAPGAVVGVVGATGVFGLFLVRYDVFYLSRAPNVRLPGGRPVFPDVPSRTPEEVLAHHGLIAGPRDVLDAAAGVAVTPWRRPGDGKSANN